MIIEFSIKNFRSVNELQTVSFSATSLKSPTEFEIVDKNNVSECEGQKVLKTIGLYGANASGKSNIIAGLVYFLAAIKNEASSESNLEDLCDPFLFQQDWVYSESMFQIVILLNKKKYRYGFTVKRNPTAKVDPNEKYSKEIVTSEWLFGTREKNMTKYFTRTGLKINKETLPNASAIPQLQYEHTLFLTHAAAFERKGDLASIRQYLISWTISNFSGFDNFRRNTLILLEREKRKEEFLNLLSSFDLKYNDVIINRKKDKPEEFDSPPEGIFVTKSNIIKDDTHKLIKLDLDKNESAGTKKIFDLAGLVLRAFNLSNTAFIIIDEIDSNFHPALLIKLINLFNDPLINKSNSQLLFASHDTNLMHPSIMRRDQFYFTEKGEDNSTRLYSLADLKGIRNDADFAKQYLAGFYGAIPILKGYLPKTSNNE